MSRASTGALVPGVGFALPPTVVSGVSAGSDDRRLTSSLRSTAIDGRVWASTLGGANAPLPSRSNSGSVIAAAGSGAAVTAGGGTGGRPADGGGGFADRE